MEELIQKMDYNFGIVVVILYVFALVLALAEFIYELYKGKINRWRLGEMGASFSVFVVNILLHPVTVVVTATMLYLVHYFIPWQIPINIWTTLLAVVVIDFLYYVEHRVEHSVRLFWAYHSIHHSSPIYNYTTAQRVSFISNLLTWIFYMPAIVLGFHPFIIFIAAGVVYAYQIWVHTELIGKLGWFEKIFITPSQHRVHHGSEEIYLDKNYGAILSIWDRMFGTYQEELHTPTYGITTPINTINPIKVHAFEYLRLFKDLKKARGLREVLGYVFREPGWSPKN